MADYAEQDGYGDELPRNTSAYREQQQPQRAQQQQQQQPASSTQLTAHILTDSTQVCVGAAIKQMRIPARSPPTPPSHPTHTPVLFAQFRTRARPGRGGRRVTAPPHRRRSCRFEFFAVNPEFLENIEWSTRCALGALLAALPALLNAKWVVELVQPVDASGLATWFDRTYGAVAFVFTFGHSVGETFK